jgi:hypothetical protein
MLLLGAGAVINLEAKLGGMFGNTLLHAWAAFKDEKVFWSPIGRQMAPKRNLDAACGLTTDTNRPPLQIDSKTNSPALVSECSIPYPRTTSILVRRESRILCRCSLIMMRTLEL